jgi:phosphate transport system protein
MSGVTTSRLTEPGAAVDLHLIEVLICEMFEAVADGVTAASKAFLDGDRVAAQHIVLGDRHVDDHTATIESMAEAGLVQPDVVDLRDRQLLVYVLRAAPELERSGDLIEHIALRTPQRLVELIPDEARGLLAEMAAIAAGMWRAAADGFTARDPSVSARLEVRDEELDDLHVDLTEVLSESGCAAAVAIEMGLVARFYERLGDHAVNVAQRAINLFDR